MLNKEDLDPKDLNVENTIVGICSLIQTSLTVLKEDTVFKDKLKVFNDMNKYQKRLKFKVLDLIEKMCVILYYVKKIKQSLKDAVADHQI